MKILFYLKRMVRFMEKYSRIVGYESIKEKCRNINSNEDIKLILKEVSQVFDKLNTMQKLKELGEMNFSKLIKKYKIKYNK